MIPTPPPGWLVNNAFQLSDSWWKVNLRRETDDGHYYTDWAQAPSLAEALEESISRIPEAEFEAEGEVAAVAEPTIPLLDRLGLRRKPTIERRI